MPTTASDLICTCNAQMQPHAPMPNVCPAPTVLRLIRTVVKCNCRSPRTTHHWACEANRG